MRSYLLAMTLVHEIEACRLCAARFAATATAHHPRPLVWFRPGARILIAGQAPGMRVHVAGRPFADRSGDRLRDWMGVDEATFYDRERMAIVPMAFCFPGYDGQGADLPPPPICARTWRARVMAELAPRLILLVGGHAEPEDLQQKRRAQKQRRERHGKKRRVQPLTEGGKVKPLHCSASIPR